MQIDYKCDPRVSIEIAETAEIVRKEKEAKAEAAKKAKEERRRLAEERNRSPEEKLASIYKEAFKRTECECKKNKDLDFLNLFAYFVRNLGKEKRLDDCRLIRSISRIDFDDRIKLDATIEFRSGSDDIEYREIKEITL